MNRDARFDNLKAFLIYSVVFGHALEFIYGIDGVYGTIRAVIYSFHMPAFVFLSGYFASRSNSPVQSAVVRYMSTYLIFNTLFALSPWRVTSPLNLFFPQVIYWYLLCLCFWRVAVVPASKIRFAVPLSVLLALYIGLCPEANRFLSISRAICFFPFFLVGYSFSVDRIARISRWAMGAVLAACLAATLLANRLGLLPVKMYEYVQSYALTEVGARRGMLMRCFMMLVSFAAIPGMLALSPARRGRLTIIGENSLMIYVLHLYPIRLIASLMPVDPGRHLYNIAFSAIASFAICLVLSLPFITDIYNRIVRGILKVFVPGETGR